MGIVPTSRSRLAPGVSSTMIRFDRKVSHKARPLASRARVPSVPRVAYDDHHLYQGSVQSVDADLGFAQRVFKHANGRPLRSIREDFCGTAMISCAFVAKSKDRRAIGVELHSPTLEWARRHNVPALGKAAPRLALLEADVRRVECDPVEAILALNFSYWVFKTRDAMRGYFEAARRGLTKGGILVLDAFGGTESMSETTDRRIIPSQTLPCGTKLPRFTYVWDQVRFNPVDHDFQCAIHFELPHGVKRRNAFTYDWRFWTIPELCELLVEAGFARAEVYVDGWDWAANDADGRYRLRSYFQHDPAWIAYVVGYAK